MKKTPHNERGNVLVYILLAVALLGSLSFAVSQGWRGGMQDVTKEKARLYANDILEYANAVGNAVAQLRLRGCSDTQISFEASGIAGYVNNNAPGDKSCHVFDLNGGGVTYKPMPPEALKSSITNFAYTGMDAVNNIGTSDSELLMYGVGISDQVCIQINKMIGQVTGDTLIQDNADVTPDPFLGIYSSNVAIGDGSDFDGVRTGCFFCGPYGENVFYKVLIAR